MGQECATPTADERWTRDVPRISTVLAAVGIVVLPDTSDGLGSSVDGETRATAESRLPLTLTGSMAQGRLQVVPAHFLRAERRSIP